MGIFDFFNKKPSGESKPSWYSKVPKQIADTLWNEIISNPQCCNSDQINEGMGEFGLENTNPVPVAGIPENEIYLNSLRNLNGEILRYRRTGSTEVANIKKPVDEYEIFNIKGDTVGFIYISPYHLKTSTKAPKGYRIK
jgi:hypothetical protein